MSAKVENISSLTQKLQIDDKNFAQIKTEENFGYKCKGKGHTLFDSCAPEKIQLFLEYYQDIPESVLENHSKSNGDVPNVNHKNPFDTSLLKESIVVPLSTLLTQFVLNYCCRESEKEQDLLTSICFIPQKYEEPAKDRVKAETPIEPYFQMKRSALSSKSVLPTFKSLNDELSNKELEIAKNCTLPALFIPEYDLCITGLCSVLRYLLQHSHTVKEQNSPLLGYQNACLSAPAEVSLWTRFCEIDLPCATKWVQNITADLIPEGVCHLPEEFAKFEMHLSQPIRMFNIRKRMQKAEKTNQFDRNSDETDRKNGISDLDAIKTFALNQHVYAEGPDCLLSDIILFMHYYLSFYASKFTTNIEKWEQILPKTVQWFHKVGELGALEIAHRLIHISDKYIDLKIIEMTLPSVPEQSLYKSDPNRHNTASKTHTRFNKVERALKSFDESKLEAIMPASGCLIIADKLKYGIDWAVLPPLVSPLEGGKLPPKRAIKKCQQLENLALSVMHLVASRSTTGAIKIVDFCSGGGHLGILLAYLLPQSIIYLVENKPESLERAINRVQQLQLKNCRFFQGNLDYFRGKFDIGVSVHACGVATDLVINMCIQNQADFVSCPCCYGSLQENHILSYPRSQYYKNENIGFEDYLVIGHTADQTHVTNDKHEQGELGMNIIDTDRIHFTKENGYSDVKLVKLEPTSCTPKNNVIIAKY